MKNRRLGMSGPNVSALGLGCMGMSEFYGRAEEAEAVATIHRALDLGVTMLDTADMYGPFTNERLVGRAVSGRRDEAVIATKFGFHIDADGKLAGMNSRPEHIREVAEASLKRLDIDAIDLLDTAGAPVLKRLAPVVAGVLLLLIVFLIRRSRSS